MHVHYVCYCKRYIFRHGDGITQTCPNCEADRYKHGKPNGLLLEYFPLTSALQLLWAQWPSWAKASYYPWEGHQSLPEAMTDIYDSPNWKKHKELESPGNMGMVLNADGMSVFQVGNYSTWPLYLMNANLPPHLR